MDFRVCYTWPQWGFGRDGTGGANVVTVLCLPARDHGACSHLSASLIPLGSLWFSVCLASWVKFIPTYLTVFDATVNGIIFLSLFWYIYYYYSETQLTFLCWFYILHLLLLVLSFLVNF